MSGSFYLTELKGTRTMGIRVTVATGEYEKYDCHQEAPKPGVGFLYTFKSLKSPLKRPISGFLKNGVKFSDSSENSSDSRKTLEIPQIRQKWVSEFFTQFNAWGAAD